MILKFIPWSRVDTAVHQLPEPDMAVDPRPVRYEDYYKFDVTVNGTALTVTRIDREEDRHPGWPDIRFRVYSRNEFHYSFESTKYLYHGIKRERAPRDATEIVVKDGVETIGKCAFKSCSFLSKISIPNTVLRIEGYAFEGCTSLRYIQLPSQFIGGCAFQDCLSLEAIYIPPTVTARIDFYAFENCKSLRIINIPDNVQQIGRDVFTNCDDLNTDEANSFTTDQQYDQWLRNRYNPLHNLCWDPSVTANNIQQYIQSHHDGEERATSHDKPQFTPLHLLAANPSVTGDMITAYLHLAPDVATMQDNKDKTPLHMICSAPSYIDGTGGAIEAYMGGCMEGRRAAFMKDDEGRTPFDYLCEKSFDELFFLENKTFAGLMIWWYDHCVDMSLFAEDIDTKEKVKAETKNLAYATVCKLHEE